MAGTITFKVKGRGDGESEAYSLRAEVQMRAAEQKIKVPAKISLGGGYYHYYEISYNTNAVRDLIMDIASDWKLEQAGWQQ